MMIYSQSYLNYWILFVKKGLNDKDTIANVKRRNNNVTKWLEEISKNVTNLKELQIKNQKLNNKWLYVIRNVNIVIILVVYYKIMIKSINLLMSINVKENVQFAIDLNA